MTAREFSKRQPWAGFLALYQNPFTLNAYIRDLQYFALYLGQLDPFKADRKMLLDFAASLSVEGLTPKRKKREPLSTETVRHVLGTVNQFYKYLEALGDIRENPATAFRLIRIKRREKYPRPLNHLERIALLANLKIATKYQFLVSLAVRLGYECGLRLSEIATLPMKSVSPEGFLRWTGKGDKERVVPLTETLRAWFSYWRSVNRGAFVFPNQRDRDGGHVKKETINRWMSRAARWASIPDFTSHRLRHTFGTQLAESGATAYQIRDLMGHGSITTSEHYVALAAAYSKPAHQKAFGGNFILGEESLDIRQRGAVQAQGGKLSA